MSLVLPMPKPRIQVAQSAYIRFQRRVNDANQKQVCYKDRKNIDGDLRSAYHNEALEGSEFARLIQSLWAI